MYKVEIIPSEKFDVDAIGRRRNAEALRKERIFHPKMRIMGVDTDALKTQIEQREYLEEVERKVDAAYHKSGETQQKIMNVLEEEQLRQKQQWDLQVDKFRKQNQQPCQRREWYLNDPQVLRKDKLPRASAEDPSATVSGLQKFAGEDLKAKERVKAQHEQVRVWAAEARLAKATISRESEKQRQQGDNAFRATVEALERLQVADDNARLERNRQVAMENQRLAQERRNREKKARELDTLAKINDIQGQISGNLLMEKSSAETSTKTLLHDAFKGMTEEQKVQIQKARAQQLEEKKRHLEDKIREESSWALQQAANDMANQLLERQQLRTRRNYNKSVACFNSKKAANDKVVQHYFDKELYTNQPTQDYFAQFNTSSR